MTQPRCINGLRAVFGALITEKEAFILNGAVAMYINPNMEEYFNKMN